MDSQQAYTRLKVLGFASKCTHLEDRELFSKVRRLGRADEWLFGRELGGRDRGATGSTGGRRGAELADASRPLEAIQDACIAHIYQANHKHRNIHVGQKFLEMSEIST